MSDTIEPITVSGLYEHTDGTVGKYTWRDGRLCHDWTESGWVEAARRDDSVAEEPTADYWE